MPSPLVITSLHCYIQTTPTGRPYWMHTELLAHLLPMGIISCCCLLIIPQTPQDTERLSLLLWKSYEERENRTSCCILPSWRSPTMKRLSCLILQMRLGNADILICFSSIPSLPFHHGSSTRYVCTNYFAHFHRLTCVCLHLSSNKSYILTLPPPFLPSMSPLLHYLHSLSLFPQQETILLLMIPVTCNISHKLTHKWTYVETDILNSWYWPILILSLAKSHMSVYSRSPNMILHNSYLSGASTNCPLNNAFFYF